jgi:hypothetical protein
VNNVRYVRWIETARIRYAESLELPGGQVRGMLVSLSTPSDLFSLHLTAVGEKGKKKEKERADI